MTDNGKNNNGWYLSGTLRWAVICISAAILIYSLSDIYLQSITAILILSVASVVASLAGKYDIRITDSGLAFRVGLFLSFWAAMWIGIGGAVILTAISFFSGRPTERLSLGQRLYFGSLAIVTIFFSSLIYTSITGAGLINATQPIFADWAGLIEIKSAALVMGLVLFASRATIDRLFTENSIFFQNKISLLVNFTNYAIALFGAIVLAGVFIKVGIAYGLILPLIALVGDLLYKLHTQSLEAKTREITEASRVHMATVEALATAIDARDQIGDGHVRRTQIYAVGLGRILGLSEDEIKALRTGALLHDIGKLAIPDHILNKPGRLTPAELEKTKIHSSVGASILDSVGFPYPVIPVVKYHHECWDGSGYPEGLRGNNIPITARILAIADTFDTLRGERPYRNAISREEASNFLRSRSGTQFDPTIVDLFLSNLKIFEKEIEAQGLGYDRSFEFSKTGSFNLDEVASPNYVEQIKRANHEVFTLYSLARDFGGSIDLNETLHLFTKKIKEFIPFDSCVVYLLDGSGKTASAAFAAGLKKDLLIERKITVGEGATGYALMKKVAVENVDPALDFGFADADIGRDYSAMLSLPLITDDSLIGAVSLYSCELPNYHDEHVRLLDTVSHIAADAISKAQKHDEAQSHALTDPLTGLPNTRSLLMEFDKEVTRASRSSSTFQLIVLDLDGFKKVNDTFGHKAGDKMLIEIGKVIREQLREYDFLSRYGGDEFVAIIPETDPADVKRLKRRIIEAVGNFVMPMPENRTASVGISLGSASYPGQGESFDELVVAADKAMYLTKAINHQRNDLSEHRSENYSEGSVSNENGTKKSSKRVNGDENEIIVEATLVSEMDDIHIISSTAVN